MSEEKMDTGLTPMPLESETRPSVDGFKRQPIVDVDGDFIWVPVETCRTEEEAISFAREESPSRPCYESEGMDWFVTRPINEDDEGEVEFSEEYGCNTIADPGEPGWGQPYWAIRVYPSSSGRLASTEPPGVSPLNPSPSAVSGQEGGE